jgi:hypothetical protein
MQALSQLSYGPTLMLRAAYHNGVLSAWEAFSSQPAVGTCKARTNKKPRPKSGLFVEAGVPTGIRTPVATVKG